MRERRAGPATAAVFGQVADQCVHVLEVGRVDDEAPFLPACHEAGPGEVGKVEGEGRRREVELFADSPGCETSRPGLHEQAMHLQACSMSEGSERFEGLVCFHISRIVKMF